MLDKTNFLSRAIAEYYETNEMKFHKIKFQCKLGTFLFHIFEVSRAMLMKYPTFAHILIYTFHIWGGFLSVLYFLSIFLRCVLDAAAASPIFGGNTVSLPIEIFYFDWISIGFSVIISFKIGKNLFMLARYQMPYLPHHNITKGKIKKNEGKEHVILEICYS